MPIGKDKGSKDKGPKDSGLEKLTPLQRYLAKQKAAQEQEQEQEQKHPQKKFSQKKLSEDRDGAATSRNDEPTIGERFAGWKSRVEATFSAGSPPSPPPPSSESPNISANLEAQPADILARFGAYILDLIILTAISKAVNRSLLWPLDGWAVQDVYGIKDSISFILYHVAAFVYYGWFYSQKGASPGKIILQIEVADARSGQRIGYWRSFLRESIGKYVSTVILFIGFLVALFRKDHRALHDLIFDTKVRRKQPNA